MADANVYELEPSTFQVVKQIRADRAHWNPSIHTWVFENGWFSDIRNNTPAVRTDFQAKAFPELNETPEYFHAGISPGHADEFPGARGIH
jgi:hypothetical protein